jgi:hypothetical protein
MTDLTDRADRARRLSQVIESHESLDIAVAVLKRVAPKLEEALRWGSPGRGRRCHDPLLLPQN